MQLWWMSGYNLFIVSGIFSEVSSGLVMVCTIVFAQPFLKKKLMEVIDDSSSDVETSYLVGVYFNTSCFLTKHKW